MLFVFIKMKSKQLQKTLKLKVILLGDRGVGKSSLFQKKIQGIKNTEQFPSATIDFSSKQHIIEDKEVALQIWDTPGSEK